jgi:uncharacterized integral membrane protein
MARENEERHTARIVIGIVVVIVLVALIVDNTRDVKIGYVFGDASMPAFVLVLLAAVLGGIVGQLVGWRSRHN